MRPWNGVYDYEIAFRERVSASYWSLAGKLKTRPRSVTIRFVATVRKIRWRRFGGRKAVGFGRMVADSPAERAGAGVMRAAGPWRWSHYA